MEFYKIFNLANILLVVSFIYKRFPPKVINDLYGYRTARSMSSQEAWDWSNRQSMDIMMRLSIVSALVYNPMIFFYSVKYTMVIGSVLIIVVLVVGHIFIERKLRRLFDKNGNRVG